MIFITTGTQEPFDRLIKVIDQVAFKFEEEVIVQAIAHNYKCQNIRLIEFLDPKEFEKTFQSARLIVSHAGMGTIISALTHDKPIIVMPRKAKLNEHRNDHQMATASKFNELGYVIVAQDEFALKDIISNLFLQKDIKPLYKLGKYASDSLINSLKDFINFK